MNKQKYKNAIITAIVMGTLPTQALPNAHPGPVQPVCQIASGLCVAQFGQVDFWGILNDGALMLHLRPADPSIRILGAFDQRNFRHSVGSSTRQPLSEEVLETLMTPGMRLMVQIEEEDIEFVALSELERVVSQMESALNAQRSPARKGRESESGPLERYRYQEWRLREPPSLFMPVTKPQVEFAIRAQRPEKRSVETGSGKSVV